MGKKFKKFIASSIIVLAGTFIMSCGEQSYKVSFNLNGGSAVESQTIIENGLVVAPTNPTKANAIFDGWYKDAGFTIPWNFNTDVVTKDTVIYAKWIENFDISLPQTNISDDGYTLTVVGGASTVSVNGNYEVQLQINTDKFYYDDFVLIRNGEQVPTPSIYLDANGRRTYSYYFTNVTEEQSLSVIGLVERYYIATFDLSPNYEIVDVEGDRNTILHGSNYSFKIQLKEGYTDSVNDISVWIGNEELIPNVEGIYTIENIEDDLDINITNVNLNKYSVNYPTSTAVIKRFELVSGPNKINHGEALIFQIKLAEKYTKAKVNEQIVINVGGEVVEAEYVFDEFSKVYTFTIPEDKVKGNINISLNDMNWVVDKYIVSFPSEMVGYKLTTNLTPIGNNKYEVPYDGSFTFKVELEEEYKYCQSFKLMFGDYNYTKELLANPTSDEVTVNWIRQDSEVRLENLTKSAFNIIVEENAGYEIVLAEGYSLPVEKGKTIKFAINVKTEEGYTVIGDIPNPTYTLRYLDNPYTSANESGGNDIPVTVYKENGYYTINDVSGDMVLNVKGITKKQFTTSVKTEQVGFRIENLPSTYFYGDTITFDVVVEDEYLDCLLNKDVSAKANGKTLSQKTNIEEKKITYTIYNAKENLEIEILGIYKNVYNVTFMLTKGGTFKDYESLGNGYTENSYTVSVKRGESAVAPSIDNIIAPQHYSLNADRPWSSTFNNIESDLIVYAEFLPTTYYISFNTNGGINAPENNTTGGMVVRYEYNIEQPIVLANPTKKIGESNVYYDFLGWFVEDDGKEINITEFTEFKDITVNAKWGIKVGANQTHKTLSEAITNALSGDKIVVLEDAQMGGSAFVDKSLEIVGENENVTININSISGLSSNTSNSVLEYVLINVAGGENLTVSNLNFNVDETLSNIITAFNTSNSNVTITNCTFENLNVIKTTANSVVKVTLDDINVTSDKDSYVVRAYTSYDGAEVVIQNSVFNVYKGVLIGTSGYYSKSIKTTIKNNNFVKEGLPEDLVSSNDIKIQGVHNIVEINNTHNNPEQYPEYIALENALNNILDKTEFETLLSKLTVNTEVGLQYLILTNYEDVIIGTDNEGGPIYETKLTKEIYYDVVNDEVSATINYATEEDLVNALEFASYISLNANIEINGEVEIPENCQVNILTDGELSLTETAVLTVNGILTTNGNINSVGTITIGTNGEIANNSKIKLGTSYEINNIISKLNFIEIDENTGNITGNVVKATKDSLVYSYYKDVVNATYYFVSFQVYVGVEKAGTTLNDIVITNENGLLYSTGTNTSNNLTDTVNSYGYIDVILDANVIDGTANLSKAVITFGGNTYEINIAVSPYVPEVLADQSYAVGYYYGAYPDNNGNGVVSIFNTYQTITENTDNTITSDTDNFTKLIASGNLAQVRDNSNILQVAPENTTKHFITFRKYVGLQFAGQYVTETYKINGKSVDYKANIIANEYYKNPVDSQGYLHYAVDADVSFIYVNGTTGVKLYEKVNLKTFQVFFTLDEETYEFRVDVQNMTVSNRSNGYNMMLGNMVDIGIESRYQFVSFDNEKYTLSGGVYKVGETELVKNNQTFYDGENNSDGYLVAYRLWGGKADGSFKSLIGKSVTVTVSGYEGRTWNGGVVLNNGWIEFITEVMYNQVENVLVGGELTITYQVEGEEERSAILVLENLTIKEDQSIDELKLRQEDFGEGGTGIEFNNYLLSQVEGNNYKILSSYFVKTPENSNAYNNEFALENSTGYFVAFKAFVGVRSWNDLKQISLTYIKDDSTVKTETRTLTVDFDGYVGLFIDTMTVGTELGLDNLLITFKNVDNTDVTYTIDFSEIVVIQDVTE